MPFGRSILRGRVNSGNPYLPAVHFAPCFFNLSMPGLEMRSRAQGSLFGGENASQDRQKSGVHLMANAEAGDYHMVRC